MTDHPSTFKGEDSYRPGIQWDDRASLHRVCDGGGIFEGAKRLRDGTLAELIRHMMLLPANDRSKYYIEKAGDREYHAIEIAELAARDDFPRS